MKKHKGLKISLIVAIVCILGGFFMKKSIKVVSLIVATTMFATIVI